MRLRKDIGVKNIMAGTGRIPLWLVALVGGLGVIVVVGTFIFGSYSGLGSSL